MGRTARVTRWRIRTPRTRQTLATSRIGRLSPRYQISLIVDRPGETNRSGASTA